MRKTSNQDCVRTYESKQYKTLSIFLLSDWCQYGRAIGPPTTNRYGEASRVSRFSHDSRCQRRSHLPLLLQGVWRQAQVSACNVFFSSFMPGRPKAIKYEDSRYEKLPGFSRGHINNPYALQGPSTWPSVLLPEAQRYKETVMSGGHRTPSRFNHYRRP